LLKLNIRGSKRTIQKDLRQARPPRPSGQTWAPFGRTHAHESWACDFLHVTDVLVRPLFACFIIELSSRRVVHGGVTPHPTDAWVTQHLREATPYDERPRFLIRENDGKDAAHCDQVAVASGIEVLRTPVHAPCANALIECFLGRVRRERLDQLLILTEAHRRRVLGQDVRYFNEARPHHGLAQQVPAPVASPGGVSAARSRIMAGPVLGGLHHTYRRVAQEMLIVTAG
jgi:putative transposase